MTDYEQKEFEAELRQLQPGKLPEELTHRLRAIERSNPAPSYQASSLGVARLSFLQVLRWLIPATAAILITAVIWRGKESQNEQMVLKSDAAVTAAATLPALKADNIQIGKELVSSFDAVATLPSGEPVRFRCQQWKNTVVVDDEKQGILVENRMPRVVVVPVRFETY